MKGNLIFILNFDIQFKSMSIFTFFPSILKIVLSLDTVLENIQKLNIWRSISNFGTIYIF